MIRTAMHQCCEKRAQCHTEFNANLAVVGMVDESGVVDHATADHATVKAIADSAVGFHAVAGVVMRLEAVASSALTGWQMQSMLGR